VLYNEGSLKEGEKIIVTEGILDCIAVEQCGYSAVALCGCNFKQEDVEKLKKASAVYICFDGDAQGRKKAEELAVMLGASGWMVQMADGKDPSEYLVGGNGRERFEQLLEEAQDSITYRIQAIPPSVSAVKRYNELDPILDEISMLGPAIQQAYLDTIADHFNLSKEQKKSYEEELRRRGRALQKRVEQSTREVKELGKFAGLVEIALYKGKPVYIVKEGGRLVIRKRAEIENTMYVPPRSKYIPWDLLEAVKVVEAYNSIEKGEEFVRDLLGDLTEYLRGNCELPDERLYEMLAAWVMHTYLLEHFQYTPYIFLVGPPGVGKTHTGQLLARLAYRGVCVNSLRPAYLYHSAEAYGLMLFIDVTDVERILRSDPESRDMILARFQRRIKTPRVNKPDVDPLHSTQYYDPFGATVLASNKNVDDILGSRGIRIYMKFSYKDFSEEVDKEREEELRVKLLCYRGMFIDRDLPKVKKTFPGRYGDSARPLLQVLLTAEASSFHLKNLFIEYMAKSGHNFIELEVVRALDRCRNRVEKGRLPLGVLLEEVNAYRDERSKITPQKLGRILSRLDIKKVRSGEGGNTEIVWDEELINKLVEEYLGAEKAYFAQTWKEIAEWQKKDREKREISAEPGALTEVSEVSEEYIT